MHLLTMLVLLSISKVGLSFTRNVGPSMSVMRPARCSRLFSSSELYDKGDQLLKNFVSNIIDDDLAQGKNGGRLLTRFPPEPNGYLHLGHAKSITINFGLAKAYKGNTHMRFDDTNPAKEDIEFVDSILEDVKWLASESNEDPWFGNIRYASDYFSTLYQGAEFLIRQGLAYVDELSAEEMRDYRGTLSTPGKNSPFRDRSVEENLQLFKDMKDGRFADGACILRAKIDMSSPNMNMRDPALYRVKRAEHPMTGNEWCIYPMYDYAHAMSDALEGITHSLCTLEFADHRPLYDWVIDNVLPSGLLPYQSEGWRPTQTEFSRLNLQYTVLSKRKLIQVVTDKHVDGWDDPRMPTLSGVRRRGYPAEAIRLFCGRMGVSKAENHIDIGLLEDCVREILDNDAPRVLAVLKPLKVTITNWPEDLGEAEVFNIERHPKRPEMGFRDISFSPEVCIDRDDFFDTGTDGSLKPPKGFKRLVPGGSVRLKYAYVITCDDVVRDSSGEAVELRCSLDRQTRSGASPEGSTKAKGIIQWVSQKHGVKMPVVLYDRLFSDPSPGKNHEDGDFLKDLNPDSVQHMPDTIIEGGVGQLEPGLTYQFERVGYFCVDKDGHRMNRVVTLRDTWGSPDKERKRDGQLKQKLQQQRSVQPAVEDVLRVDFRVGKILSAKKHPDADSLYVEQIDVGDADGPRTIVSGLAKHIPLEDMTDKTVIVICNLKPSKMRGVVSEGMILAASIENADGSGEAVELVMAPEGAQPGDIVRIDGYGEPQPDAVLKSKTAQDALKRVLADLTTDTNKVAVYADGKALQTSAGPCSVSNLANAIVR